MDAETGLLLRSELIDEDGEVVEQVSFTRIDVFPELADAMVEPTLAGEVLQWSVADEREAGSDDQWLVANLPAGFSQQSVRKHKRGTVQRMYSDGIATVSVFIEATADSKKSLSGTSRMGAVSAFGTVIDGHQVTVVGEGRYARSASHSFRVPALVEEQAEVTALDGRHAWVSCRAQVCALRGGARLRRWRDRALARRPLAPGACIA